MNYLYNGVELPDIRMKYTEEVETKYPYAFIYHDVYVDKYWLFAFATKQTHLLNYSEDGSGFSFTPYMCVYWKAWSRPSRDNWYSVAENYNPTGFFTAHTNESYCNEVIWSNYDILNEDGSVYLAASDPIPVPTFNFDPISMTMVWLVGRRIAAQRGKYVEPDVPDVPVVPDEPERQLIGYSYNGVVLPDINEVWTDKETYPYAYIESDNPVFYAILLTNTPVKYVNGSYLVANTSYSCWFSDGVSFEFYLEGTVDADGVFTSDSTPIWSNTDILTTAGSIYLAASEPVPVYES